MSASGRGREIVALIRKIHRWFESSHTPKFANYEFIR